MDFKLHQNSLNNFYCSSNVKTSLFLFLRARRQKEKQVREGGKEEDQAEEDQIKVGPKWEEEESVLSMSFIPPYKPLLMLYFSLKLHNSSAFSTA